MMRRKQPDVKRYDWFKLGVTLILVAMIVILLLRDRTPSPTTVADAPATATSQATATERTVVPTATQAPSETLALSAATPKTTIANVATLAPATPTLVPLALDTPTRGFQAGHVELVGRGAPNQEVALTLDGQTLGTATTNAKGQWTWSGEISQSGIYQLEAGYAGGAKTRWTLDIRPAYAPLEIGKPRFGKVVSTGTGFTGQLSIDGRGEPGGSVLAILNGEPLALTTIDPDGTWVISALAVIAQERSEIVFQMNDPNSQLIETSQPLVVEISANDTMHMPTLELANDAEQPMIQGTGTPGSTLAIAIDGNAVAQVQIGANGVWSYPLDVKPGAYQLTASVLDEQGSELARTEPLQVTLADTAADSTPTPTPRNDPTPAPTAEEPVICTDDPPLGIDRGDSYVVARCEYMALIARRTGISLEALLAANPQVENPDLIHPDQVLNLPPRN